MGLRHRTPLSALREQRRCAEQRSQSTSKSALSSFPRKVGRIRLSAVTPGNEPSRLTWSTGPLDALPVPEKCQMLLARLRSTLQPQDEAERAASDALQTEYQTLQDELERLAQHTSQQRQVQTEAEAFCRELLIPMSFQSSAADDEAPYRTLVIKADAKPIAQNLRALDGAPTDLSIYWQEQKPVALPPPVLSLVAKSKNAIDNSPASVLIDESQIDPELSSEAAKLMQQNLRMVLARAGKVEIPSDVILSLLDT